VAQSALNKFKEFRPMNRPGLRSSLFILLCLLLIGAAADDKTAPFDWPIPGGKIGKAGKNLHVLPFDDLFDLVWYMQEIQRALGVTCVRCHNLDDFAVDDPDVKFKRNLHKNAARNMIRMVLNINEYIRKDPYLEVVVGPPLFGPGDLKQTGDLADKWKRAKDPLSQYLYEQSSEAARGLLGQYDGLSDPSEPLRQALVDELNRRLEDQRLYDEQRFAGVQLTEETKTLIEQSPTGDDLIRLNRSLLEEAYSSEIAKAHSVSCFMCHRGSQSPSRERASAQQGAP
jgi:hypothetical protein